MFLGIWCWDMSAGLICWGSALNKSSWSFSRLEMALTELETCLNGDVSELMNSVTPELAVCLGPGSKRWVYTYLLLVTGRIFSFVVLRTCILGTLLAPPWCTGIQGRAHPPLCLFLSLSKREVVPGLALCLHPCHGFFATWVNCLGEKKIKTNCLHSCYPNKTIFLLSMGSC